MRISLLLYAANDLRGPADTCLVGQRSCREEDGDWDLDWIRERVVSTPPWTESPSADLVLHRLLKALAEDPPTDGHDHPSHPES